MEMNECGTREIRWASCWLCHEERRTEMWNDTGIHCPCLRATVNTHSGRDKLCKHVVEGLVSRDVWCPSDKRQGLEVGGLSSLNESQIWNWIILLTRASCSSQLWRDDAMVGHKETCSHGFSSFPTCILHDTQSTQQSPISMARHSCLVLTG